MLELLSDPAFWKHLSIPVVAGLIGWGTNWLAIQMTFAPLDFVGIPPWLGWQGIIPAKARKMASIAVDATLASLREIFDRMEPERIAGHVVRTFEPRLDDMIDELMRERGVAVGYVTNWLALHLIFEPLEPTRNGPWTFQGQFLRRQKEVAATCTRLVTRNVLTVRHFVDAMLNGPKGDRTRALIREHVWRIVDETVGVARPAVRLAVGSGEYERLKETVSAKALEIARDPFDDPVFNEERASVVERVTRERMEAMTPAGFRDLLRPAFEEDEYKLIVVGAFLGLVAGMLQLVLVFGS